jgi:hypothetical protein
VSESRAEQIVEALRARFVAAIVADGGATYWNTPAIVARVPGFTQECLEAGAGLVSAGVSIITLSPDAPDQVEGLTFSTMKAQILVHVASATAFTDAEVDALHPATTHREILQDRLLRDIETAVGTSNTLGGLCLWARIVERDKAPQRTFAAGWAVAYASVLIEYAYPEGQP